MAPPFQQAEFDILYGQGISRDGEVLDLAVKLDIIQKSGSWFSYNGERLGQGRDKVRDYLRDNPAFCEEVAQKVMENRDQLKKVPGGKAAAPKKLGQVDLTAEVEDNDEASE